LVEDIIVTYNSSHPVNFFPLLFSESHLHIFFLLSDDLESLEVALKRKVVLMPVTKSPEREQYALDKYYVAWGCLLGT
jgi:hypothetical protein